ncbi:M23 family metallopeptidase [Tenacibaculum discolor]|uniref:M23 family metallopeptidase n=2 Tax=Tenacibaculum TaxID=104267 RepID=UPI001FC9B74E|nr:M23 family metallopeptidase [Tenacibaculum discolor]
MGGNIVVILGPKWRLHYYAHLEEVKTTSLTFVNNNSVIGTVGTSGNAAGKAPHLHYSIFTLIPYVWKIDSDKQGWKKMFYLNPIDYLED